MKRFAILREVDPDMSWDDADTGALQNIVNMHATNVPQEIVWTQGRGLQGVRWIRSYWEQGTSWGLCLYEGESTAQVEEWNVNCEVPFVEVREIEEQQPVTPIPYQAGFHADPTVSRLVALECPATVDVEKLLAGHGIAGTIWIRSYVDPQRGAAISLYQVDLPNGETIHALEAEGWKLRRVVEITPGDYVDME